MIPPDLEGRLLRNGPNPALIPADRSQYHWFTGDGMIHAIELEGGKAVSYRNRWVRTRKLAAELGTTPPKGPSEPVDGTANTHVIRHAGRTLALVESGFPHALSPDLERARIHDFDGSLSSPMTAHPKVDPDSGALVFFGYDVFGPPFLRSHVVDAGGVLVQTEEIDVPRAVMMHDFGVTATRMVVPRPARGVRPRHGRHRPRPALSMDAGGGGPGRHPGSRRDCFLHPVDRDRPVLRLSCPERLRRRPVAGNGRGALRVRL